MIHGDNSPAVDRKNEKTTSCPCGVSMGEDEREILPDKTGTTLVSVFLFYTFVDLKGVVQPIQEKVEPGFYRIKESVQDKVYGKTGKESIDAFVL